MTTRRLALLLTLALAACGPKPDKILVDPAEVRFNSTGETLVLMPRLLGTDGQPMKHEPFIYVSTNDNVAAVRQDGTVTAGEGGAAIIRVSLGKVVATVPVKVSLPAKLTLKVACVERCTNGVNGLRFEGVGAKAKLSWEVLDGEGQKMTLVPELKVDDPDFRGKKKALPVDVTKEGELTASDVGRAMVSAAAGAAGAQLLVNVELPVVDKVVVQVKSMWLKPGAQEAVRAVPLRRTKHGDQKIEGAKLLYTSSNEDVARVDEKGMVTAVAEGTAEILSAVDAKDAAFDQTMVVVSNKDRPVAAPAKATVKASPKKAVAKVPAKKKR